MSQVFVSYAHKNDKFVAVLKKQLSDAGFEPMVDTDFLRAGEDWRQEIDAAIRGSFALIVVMSPDAFESKYVTYEWAFALGIGIKVIPLMLEQTKLHPRLDTLQYIPFDEHFNLDKAWEKLFTRLKQIETEHKISLKNKIAADAPTHIQGAIDLLNDPQYSYTSDEGLLGNLRNAVNTLASSKNPIARTAFLQGFEHPNPIARMRVIGICGHKQDKTTIPFLIDASHDIDISVQRTAIWALASIGDKQCLEGIINGLGDSSPEVRIFVVDKLSNFKSSQVVSVLLTALQDYDYEVRAHAAQSLGMIGDARAQEALSKLLGDEIIEVQKFASEALKRIGTDKALKAAAQWQKRMDDDPFGGVGDFTPIT